MNPTLQKPPAAPPAPQSPAQPIPVTVQSSSVVQAPVLNNIPVHTQSMPVPPNPSEDAELDNMMQAVGNALKKEDEQRPKKRFSFSLGQKKKAKNPAPPPAAPQPQSQLPATVAAQPQPGQLPPPTNAPAVKQPPAKAAKAPKPVIAVFLAALVTGVLSAVAVVAFSGS